MIGPYDAYTHDVETYKTFTLYGFRHMGNETVLQFSNVPGYGGTFAEMREWFATAKREAMFIGFNSLGFDNHLLKAILNGTDDARVLYDLGQQVFESNQGPWLQNSCSSADGEISIDLMAIAGKVKGEPNLGSLKELAIKLGFKRVQELPIPPGQETLTDAEMHRIVPYNTLDLEITAKAASMMAGAILSRFAMRDEFGVNVLNDGDAKLAERIMRHELFGDGKTPYSNQKSWLLTGDKLVNGFDYMHPELQAVRDRIKAWQIRSRLVMADAGGGRQEKKIETSACDEEVKVGITTYTIGRGGLHSKDQPNMTMANDHYLIKYADVSGCYPAVISNHKIVPLHLSASKFLSVFDGLRERRTKAKAKASITRDPIDKAIDAGLKISTNSLFGKTGNPYSWLCDPPALMQCTIKGQLSLLLLIDYVAQFDDCTVLSCNTDGLFLKLPVAVADDVVLCLTELAASMKLVLDWNDYQMVARRSINDYFSIDVRGKVTGKGAYGFDPTTLRGKPVNLICIDAMQRYFQDNVPIEQTVRGCDDLLRFINYQKVDKSHTLISDDGVCHGKIARWYIATANGHHIDKVRTADGKKSQIVEAGAVVINDLPEQFPDDIDYQFYIDVANRLVKDVLEPETKESRCIPLAELSKAQRAQHIANHTETNSDPQRCASIDLARAKDEYAKMIAGNSHSTMLRVLNRVWYAGRGTLTYGDMMWLGAEIDLDGSWGPSGGRNLGRMVDSLTRKVSPFPLPQTTAEYVDRAIIWATEKVEPLKRKRHIHHRDLFDSSFISGDALRKYAKTGDEYALACSISAVGVKHDALPDAAAIIRIIEEVKAHFTAHFKQDILQHETVR